MKALNQSGSLNLEGYSNSGEDKDGSELDESLSDDVLNTE
jgi:hypothetical protein